MKVKDEKLEKKKHGISDFLSVGMASLWDSPRLGSAGFRFCLLGIDLAQPSRELPSIGGCR